MTEKNRNKFYAASQTRNENSQSNEYSEITDHGTV